MVCELIVIRFIIYNIHTCIAFPTSHNSNTFAVLLEYEEDCYLFYFDSERKYSIAQRKLITCEDGDLVIGAKLKVKDGAKFFIGSLLNIGKNIENSSVFIDVITTENHFHFAENHYLVNNTTRTFVPVLGKRTLLENVLQIQESMLKTPGINNIIIML